MNNPSNTSVPVMQDQLQLAGVDDAPGPRAELVDPANTIRFMLAGNAYVTFQSRKTDTRYTYRIVAASFRAVGKYKALHFVSVLTGSDTYTYLGCIFNRETYAHGRKSELFPSAPSAVAFTWVWHQLMAGQSHDKLAVYHEGRCGACGRRLTTPESISLGLGPTCAERSGL